MAVKASLSKTRRTSTSTGKYNNNDDDNDDAILPNRTFSHNEEGGGQTYVPFSTVLRQQPPIFVMYDIGRYIMIDVVADACSTS